MGRIPLFAVLLWLAIVAQAHAHRCVGDCDGSDTVTINEMVNGVRIALEEVDLDSCFPFDADLDGMVSINELLVAINNVFSYCGHGSPPTPVPTATVPPLRESLDRMLLGP